MTQWYCLSNGVFGGGNKGIKEVWEVRRRKGMNREEGGAEEERKGREREK